MGRLSPQIAHVSKCRCVQIVCPNKNKHFEIVNIQERHTVWIYSPTCWLCMVLATGSRDIQILEVSCSLVAAERDVSKVMHHGGPVLASDLSSILRLQTHRSSKIVELMRG